MAIGGKVATPELANLFAQLEGKMAFSWKAKKNLLKQF